MSLVYGPNNLHFNGVVYFAALQQFIFNAHRRFLVRMIRESNNKGLIIIIRFTSILDIYLPECLGKDAIDGFLLSSSMGTVGFPKSSWTIFAEGESSKTPR